MKSVIGDDKHRSLFFASGAAALLLIFFTVTQKTLQYKSNLFQVTPEISIPVPAGEKQHGSAWFMAEEKFPKYFTLQKMTVTNPENIDEYKTVNIQKGGLPVAFEKKREAEHIWLITGDVNTLIIGATRSGKSRGMVIQGICLQGLAGEDICVTDPKGELYYYTSGFLEKLGYKCVTLDFKKPAKSSRYNFLQHVIDAVNDGDITKAAKCAWDIVDSMVVKSGNDAPVWSNGEKSIIAASIISVVYDNSLVGIMERFGAFWDVERIEQEAAERRKYQNMANVYNFVSQMTKTNPDNKTLLSLYAGSLPDSHPAKLILALPENAPDEMKGSFIASALATLRLFTDPNIADMTSCTDNGFFDKENKKAIFIILPDQTKTYYPVATIFVNQYYEWLVELADSKGGRLDRQMNFNLDEFGNFAKIEGFDNKMTVCLGRRMRFNLYIQALEQLKAQYGKEIMNIIIGNCGYFIYLKTDDSETLKSVSDKCGKYTVMTGGQSASEQKKSTEVNISASMSLLSRNLLFPEEIAKIERPFMLVLTGGYPVMMKSGDLSQWGFNKALGLGDMEHNKNVIYEREKKRPARDISKLDLWNMTADLETVYDLIAALEKENENENDTENGDSCFMDSNDYL